MRRSDWKRWVVIGDRDACFCPYAIFMTRSAAEKYIEDETRQFLADTKVDLKLSLISVDYFKE